MGQQERKKKSISVSLGNVVVFLLPLLLFVLCLVIATLYYYQSNVEAYFRVDEFWHRSALIVLVSLLSVLFCGFGYLFLVWLWGLCSKWRYSDFLLLAFATIISILGKFLILYFTDTKPIGDVGGVTGNNDVLAHYVHMLFEGAIGSVAAFHFEGLSFSMSINNLFLAMVYYGLSVIVGLFFVLVVASKAAYGFYSRLSYNAFSAMNKDVYVFSSVNKMTLSIAASIREEYDRPKRDCLIIFAGRNLPPFDRHQTGCDEVMREKYLYLSGEFHLPNKARKIRVFSFRCDEDGRIDEEANARITFTDATERVKKMEETFIKYKKASDIQKVFSRRFPKWVSYYILTHKHFDFRVYEKRVKDTLQASNPENEDPQTFTELLPSYIAIHPWSPTISVTKQVTETIASLPMPKQDTWVWTIGWNSVSEAISEAIDASTTAFDKDGKNCLFKNEVFDHDEHEAAAQYKIENPCAIVGININPEDLDSFYKAKQEALNKRLYKQAIQGNDENVKKKHPKEKEHEFLALAEKTIPYPLYHFRGKNEADSMLYDFCESVRSLIENSETRFPDYIIIATEDDDYNIRTANALVADFANTPVSPKPSLFVFISNPDNNHLLFGYDEKLKGDGCISISHQDQIVYVVGNNDIVFSYGHIHVDDEVVQYSYVYEQMKAEAIKDRLVAEKRQGWFVEGEGKGLIKQIQNICQGGKDGVRTKLDKKLKRLPAIIWDRMKAKPDDEIRKRHNGLPIWKQYNNMIAYAFMNRYVGLMAEKESEGKTLTLGDLANYAKLEHYRWMRFSFAGGWKYGKHCNDDLQTGKQYLLDLGLLPIECKPDSDVAIDVGFVLMALKDKFVLDEEKDDQKP